MPILKFQCINCGKEFAKIFVDSSAPPKSCPVCGASSLEVSGTGL